MAWLRQLTSFFFVKLIRNHAKNSNIMTLLRFFQITIFHHLSSSPSKNVLIWPQSSRPSLPLPPFVFESSLTPLPPLLSSSLPKNVLPLGGAPRFWFPFSSPLSPFPLVSRRSDAARDHGKRRDGDNGRALLGAFDSSSPSPSSYIIFQFWPAVESVLGCFAGAPIVHCSISSTSFREF